MKHIWSSYLNLENICNTIKMMLMGEQINFFESFDTVFCFYIVKKVFPFQKCFNDEERKKIVTCFKTISVLKDFGDVPIDENQLLEDINNGKGSDRQSSLHDRSVFQVLFLTM